MAVSKQGMTHAQLMTKAASAAQGDFTIDDRKTIVLPVLDADTRKSSLAVAFLARVTSDADEYTVLLAYLKTSDGEDEYRMSCGDRFVCRGDTLIAESEAKARSAEAAQPFGGADALQTRQMASYASQNASTPCQFHMMWRKDQVLCDHTQAFLHLLNAENPLFADELKNKYEEVIKEAKSGPKPKGDTFDLEELAFRVPVLFLGDRGAGKTLTARAFARENGYRTVELGCHEGLEAIDFLGYSMPAPNGDMVWLDGALSEAFRAARKGKVVFILDELLRTRARELSILLTALSPDQGVYRVRTNRILSVEDGVASVEVLEAPVSNLCIVATSNVGSEYAIDESDPALTERFVPIRKDTSPEGLKLILGIVCSEKGFRKSVATKVMTFYTKMVEARKRGLVPRLPTTRTLCRALELASNELDIPRALKSQLLLWVANDADGVPVANQVKAVNELITAAFK